MSLITRCPACATMFKVVPDQLRVSDGWVRCGQCDEVFDANAHLQPPSEMEAESVAPEESSQLDWDGTLEEEVAAPASGIQLDFPDEVDLEAVKPAAEEESAVPEGEPDAQFDSPESGGAEPVAQAADLQDVVPGNDVIDGRGVDADEVPPAHPLVEPAGQGAEGVSAKPPGFLRKSPKDSRQSGRSKRILGVTCCLMLVCSLGMQVLVQERDRIAATEPATLVLLQPLCDVLDCKIAPLRQIESVAIDHSAFSKVQSDVYRFSFAIKSTALVAVAVPSLELTLTDLQDRPVIRRVFQPRELGAQAERVVPGGEWAGSVAVQIKMPEGTVGIAGYRLLAFYP